MTKYGSGDVTDSKNECNQDTREQGPKHLESSPFTGSFSEVEWQQSLFEAYEAASVACFARKGDTR